MGVLVDEGEGKLTKAAKDFFFIGDDILCKES